MISAIIPVYQESDAVIELIRELFDKHRVGECIVVDASETARFNALSDVAEGVFSDRKLVYLAADQKGRAAQMNQGAAVSEGSILLFLHADTQLPDEALILIQEGVRQGAHWGRFDVRFDNDSWPFTMIAAMMNWRSRHGGIATGDQAIFMTRAAFDLVNGFDEIPLMEDIAISRKLKNIDYPLCFEVPVVTSARRWEQKGVFRTILLMWWLRLAYWLGVDPKRLAAWYR